MTAKARAKSSDILLSVRDLVVEFATDQGIVRAVDGVSFTIKAGETVGLVGESGCGKTVTGLAILGLIPSPPGRIVSGSIELQGQDLTQLSEPALRKIRGSEISMIFQEPMTALNPVFRIGSQMIDVLRRHQQLSKRQAHAAAIEMLAKVGIPDPAVRIEEYPHQLSGGMRQRVMIAMALSCGPKLLIADEPTTALDVTTQAQVIEQIIKLQSEFGMAMILITHDLGVVAETCRQAIVMYCGSVLENAPVTELFAHPRHPYTLGLLGSIPRLQADRQTKLPIISGMVPDLLHLPSGCRFADRCNKVMQQCRQQRPLLGALPDTSTKVACYDPH
ncbi:MAG: ABC transporter ATP-binding protein [Gammaproteobacteria bacterium]|nr:ABC transporter ATP-binding protein [Gammaproteobacteria bacterium]MCP4088741.1 ABC transporter ATP-binding protein [Gammaproteobacteria bacterium]